MSKCSKNAIQEIFDELPEEQKIFVQSLIKLALKEDERKTNKDEVSKKNE